MAYSPATVPLAAMQAAVAAMEAYVPRAQRETARAAALAYSIGYSYPTADVSKQRSATA